MPEYVKVVDDVLRCSDNNLDLLNSERGEECIDFTSGFFFFSFVCLYPKTTVRVFGRIYSNYRMSVPNCTTLYVF